MIEVNNLSKNFTDKAQTSFWPLILIDFYYSGWFICALVGEEADLVKSTLDKALMCGLLWSHLLVRGTV